jgi:hypothetical protein
MPPAPDCDYYWPPSFEHCNEKYEKDLIAQPKHQVPIRRVLILGAGFSAAFQFATADKIVQGVVSYFEKWRPSDWYHDLYMQLQWWLDHKYPNWRNTPPSLYEFLASFFSLNRKNKLKSFAKNSDPFVLFNQNISWETGNTISWIDNNNYLPKEDTYKYLLAFEALLAVYLLYGRMEDEVQVPWAQKLFKIIEPTDAILTFNWDVIPEALMVTVDTPFCRYDWTRERTKLIKLHGSVDLFGAPNIIMRGDLKANRERFECITDELWRARTSDDVLIRTKRWPSGRLIPPSERYNKSAVHIMPPYYPLGYGYRLIQFNWRKARTALERAKEIHIIGYSMPDEDMAFRSLARAVSRRWDSQVCVDVWNPDPMVKKRAEQLFGRKRVTFHESYASSFSFR